MKKYNKSVATLALAFFGCAVPAADQFDSPKNNKLILNGYEGSFEDFPSIGAFVYEGGTEENCTVSLIRKDLALTAAHCINPDSLNPESLGELDPKFVMHGRNEVFWQYCEKEQCDKHLYKVTAAVRHPQFKLNDTNTENRYDFALLLLEREIPDTEPIELLPKIKFEEALKLDNIVTIAGFGGHYEDLFTDLVYGKLYAANIPITDFYNNAEIIIGEKDPTKGNACFGDSGGPAYVYSHDKVQLAGVASRIPEQTNDKWQCGYGIIYGLPTLEEVWIESEYERLRKKYPLATPVDQNRDQDWYIEGKVSCQFSPSSSNSSSTSSGILAILLLSYALKRRRNL